MASTSAVAMAVMPPTPSTTPQKLPSTIAITTTTTFKPLKTGACIEKARVESKVSVNEQAVAGLTAAALAAAFLVPEIAEAAQPGVSPSLKNFLLSIVSGGVVLTAILGAVIGVSNFDPVKRT